MQLDELLRDWATIRSSTRSSSERQFLLETWVKLRVAQEDQQQMLEKLAAAMPAEEERVDDGIYAGLSIRPTSE